MPRTVIPMPRTTAGTRTTAGSRQLARDFGTCLVFNGSTSTINCGAYASFLSNLISGSFTVSFWQKGTSTSSTINWAGFSNGGSNTAFLLQPNRDSTGSTSVGKVNLFMRDNSNNFHNVATTNSVSINNAKWRHVTITGTPSLHVYQIYVDGVAVGTTVQNTTNVTNWTSSTFGMGIGARYISSSASQFFPGQLDDFRFYNIALTATQVSNLFYGIDSPLTGLFSWYKFDEGSGTTATDSSGNANTGTITAATYSNDVFIIPRTSA